MHKFEVGDTGKTGAEDRYEVIGVNDTMVFVAISRRGGLTYDVRDLNGSPTMQSVTYGQLIPGVIKSIRNVWLNVYAASNYPTAPSASVYGYDSEKAAIVGAGAEPGTLVTALPVQLEWEK